MHTYNNGIKLWKLLFIQSFLSTRGISTSAEENAQHMNTLYQLFIHIEHIKHKET